MADVGAWANSTGDDPFSGRGRHTGPAAPEHLDPAAAPQGADDARHAAHPEVARSEVAGFEVAGFGAAGFGVDRREAERRRRGDRSRRSLLRGAAMLALGGGLGVTAMGELANARRKRSPLAGSVAAATIDAPGGVTGSGNLVVTWQVTTDRPLVALTFDDGPRPKWTNMVLDILEEYRTPATFFVVGQRVREHPEVLRGRVGRHEIGNHTWGHVDLGHCGAAEARSELLRTHEAIVDVTGRAPGLFRPPYGHLGGSAILAAADLGYHVVLWSRKMHEGKYRHTSAQVEALIRETTPGNIVLAHDVGAADRLVALRGLPAMITGLRARGYEFVTVSELMANETKAPAGEAGLPRLAEASGTNGSGGTVPGTGPGGTGPGGTGSERPVAGSARTGATGAIRDHASGR